MAHTHTRKASVNGKPTGKGARTMGTPPGQAPIRPTARTAELARALAEADRRSREHMDAADEIRERLQREEDRLTRLYYAADAALLSHLRDELGLPPSDHKGDRTSGVVAGGLFAYWTAERKDNHGDDVPAALCFHPAPGAE